MLSFNRLAAILPVAVAASVLIPWTADDFDRNAALDIELVRSGKVEYRGIEASFEELSRAYALTVFSAAEFLGWAAVPNPTHPEAEALVTCRFRVAAVAPRPAAAGALAEEARQRSVPSLEVTWCLNTLAGIGITAHDAVSRDAVATFRGTVDDFLDRLVLVAEGSACRRRGPGAGHAVVDTLEAGTALVREEEAGEWTRVRPAGSSVHGAAAEGSGWLRSDRLVRVSEIDREVPRNQGNPPRKE